jgi:hypothetical protein
MMLSVERMLQDGALLTLVMSALLLISFLVNPRIWLQDYPEALRKMAPPLTTMEKRQRLVFAVPFLLGFLLIPFLAARAYLAWAGESATLFSLYLHVFVILNLFNLFDAVAIDWFFLGVLHPRFALIPEAWGRTDLLLDVHKGVRDWLKGIVFCTVFALIITVAALLVHGV